MSCGGARLRVLSTGGPRSDDPTRLVRARAHHRDGFHFPVPVLTPAEAREHRDTFAPRNLPSRGQEIAVEVDEARGVDEYHHFAPEQPPAADLAPEARAPRRPPVTSP